MNQDIRPIIGVDESGKGDFFGPLVVAGVLLDDNACEQELMRLGVRDSKTIADKKVSWLAEEIKKSCIHNIVVVNPEKYNELYGKIKNLNRLLGWGHARVIENILALKPAPAAISDKFGNDHFIINNLLEKGRKIDLLQMVRAESHPAVAAASILARAEFLRRMEALSRQYGMTIPRGASSLVDAAGKKLVASHGEDVLYKIAKINFKNRQKILR